MLDREPMLPGPPPYLNAGIGFASAEEVWVLHVSGGPAFAANAIAALAQLHAERVDGPTRVVLERLRDALVEASGPT